MNICPAQPRRSFLPLLFALFSALSLLLSACQPSPAPAAASPTAVILAEPTDLPMTVTVSQAAELRDSGAFMLDVREVEEWNQAHIPNATLIPLGQLPGRLSEVPKDQPVVVYCRSGNRSQSGRDILLGAGFTNVTSMSGGINDWIAKGFSVEP